MSKRKWKKEFNKGWTNMPYIMWHLLGSCTTDDAIPNTHAITDKNSSLNFHIEKENNKNGD